jgi:hypothetical protein
MSFTEKFELLNNQEKERFSKVTNYLLNKTFILRETFEAKDRVGKISADFRFVERNLELFSEYLALSGYTVEKDDRNGIISVKNAFEGNLMQVDKFTTLMLLSLRQIYDQKLEGNNPTKVIFISVGDVVIHMLENKLLTKKPTIKETVESLRILLRHNLIGRFDGNLENSNMIITLYPTILKVVSNEKISVIYKNIFNQESDSAIENAPKEE